MDKTVLAILLPSLGRGLDEAASGHRPKRLQGEAVGEAELTLLFRWQKGARGCSNRTSVIEETQTEDGISI